MSDNANNSPSKKKPLEVAAKYTGIGIQMAAVIGLGTWLGMWLDGETPEFPLYTLICSLLAVFAAIYLVIRQLLHDSK